jgi:hypothetical protein
VRCWPRWSRPVAGGTRLRPRSVACSARWPNTVCLGGVRDVEQADASRLLRQMVTDSLRRDGDCLPAEVIADRLDVRSLVATMRRGMHGVGNVAVAHLQAIENLVRGRSQL